MRIHFSLGPILAAALFACSSTRETTAPPPPPPPPAVLLKDIEIPNLPSPFYYFEYDAAGRVDLASFASGFLVYTVTYADGRLSEMANDAVGNRDKLEYSYDGAGRVSEVDYVDPDGLVYATVGLSYDGQRLTRAERSRKIDADFVVEKTMSFSYDADGNVLEIVEHRPAIAGRQDETTTVDRFEGYDDKINVDAFSLLHDEFFDHLVLLPGVQLQKGNPARQIHTGDGINYTVDYTYSYDGANRPLRKDGVLEYTNGADSGRTFQTLSTFSYY